MTDSYLAEIADEFWDAAGGAPPPPRDLLDAAPTTLPLAIVTLPALGFGRIRDWLTRHGVADPFRERDRRVHGCLIARGGHGIVFIDGADASDERRFTLAHEVAHFLIDYRQPRERAIRLLGPSITPVLDGTRPPTASESIQSALVNCPLGVHIHLLEREGDLGVTASAAESRVDRLAWELLAPAALVTRLSAARSWDDTCERLLIDRFALPPTEAARYTSALRRRFGSPRSFVDWLRP